VKDEEWLQEFYKIMLQYDSLGEQIFGVGGGMIAPTVKPEASLEGLEKLPVILSSMKRLPKPKHKKLRSFKKLMEASVDAYIKSCGWGLKRGHISLNGGLSSEQVECWRQQRAFFSLAESYGKRATEELDHFLEKQ
jgi:hypothetical protein